MGGGLYRSPVCLHSNVSLFIVESLLGGLSERVRVGVHMLSL